MDDYKHWQENPTDINTKRVYVRFMMDSVTVPYDLQQAMIDILKKQIVDYEIEHSDQNRTLDMFEIAMFKCIAKTPDGKVKRGQYDQLAKAFNDMHSSEHFDSDTIRKRYYRWRKKVDRIK